MIFSFPKQLHVSVAGCLGYDVMERQSQYRVQRPLVSVAGCLGYDVQVFAVLVNIKAGKFQLLVV